MPVLSPAETYSRQHAMLTAYKLPEFPWEPAVAHAAYVQNMSYTKVLPHVTPSPFPRRLQTFIVVKKSIAALNCK